MLLILMRVKFYLFAIFLKFYYTKYNNFNCYILLAHIAQLNRAFPSEGKGHEFESHYGHQFD